VVQVWSFYFSKHARYDDLKTTKGGLSPCRSSQSGAEICLQYFEARYSWCHSRSFYIRDTLLSRRTWRDREGFSAESRARRREISEGYHLGNSLICLAATLVPDSRTTESAFRLLLDVHRQKQRILKSWIRERPSVEGMCGNNMRRMHHVAQEIIGWPGTNPEGATRRFHPFFGGMIIILAENFRQTLLVIPRSTPTDELDACLKQ